MDSLMKPLDDILQEYSLIELDIEIKIKDILDKIQNDCTNFNEHDENLDIDADWKIENNKALIRNRHLLQKLEQTKAKLRSSYCYQLASESLNSQMKRYINYMELKYNPIEGRSSKFLAIHKREQKEEWQQQSTDVFENGEQND